MKENKLVKVIKIKSRLKNNQVLTRMIEYYNNPYFDYNVFLDEYSFYIDFKEQNISFSDIDNFIKMMQDIKELKKEDK